MIRFTIVMFTVFFAVELAHKLDKFLSILGALLCAPIAFTLPTLCHLNLVAKTPREKLVDHAMIIFSIVILVFCTSQGIQSWNTE